MADGALAHARQHQASRIFCGHTHNAMHKRNQEHGIDYFNCGAWIDAHPTYITIGEEGVQIHEYVERPDDGQSGKDRTTADSEPADFADESGLLEDGEYENVGH